MKFSRIVALLMHTTIVLHQCKSDRILEYDSLLSSRSVISILSYEELLQLAREVSTVAVLFRSPLETPISSTRNLFLESHALLTPVLHKPVPFVEVIIPTHPGQREGHNLPLVQDTVRVVTASPTGDTSISPEPMHSADGVVAAVLRALASAQRAIEEAVRATVGEENVIATVEQLQEFLVARDIAVIGTLPHFAKIPQRAHRFWTQCKQARKEVLAGGRRGCALALGSAVLKAVGSRDDDDGTRILYVRNQDFARSASSSVASIHEWLVDELKIHLVQQVTLEHLSKFKHAESTPLIFLAVNKTSKPGPSPTCVDRKWAQDCRVTDMQDKKMDPVPDLFRLAQRYAPNVAFAYYYRDDMPYFSHAFGVDDPEDGEVLVYGCHDSCESEGSQPDVRVALWSSLVGSLEMREAATSGDVQQFVRYLAWQPLARPLDSNNLRRMRLERAVAVAASRAATTSSDKESEHHQHSDAVPDVELVKDPLNTVMFTNGVDGVLLLYGSSAASASAQEIFTKLSRELDDVSGIMLMDVDARINQHVLLQLGRFVPDIDIKGLPYLAIFPAFRKNRPVLFQGAFSELEAMDFFRAHVMKAKIFESSVHESEGKQNPIKPQAKNEIEQLIADVAHALQDAQLIE